MNFLNIEKKIYNFFFKYFMFSSRFMLFPTFKKKKLVYTKLGEVSKISRFISRFMLFSTLKNHCLGNIEKCPFTYWLNGRWFLQIVDRDSGNLYPI